MSVTYALASTSFKIKGIARIDTFSWNIHFENLSEARLYGQVIENKKPYIEKNTTVINGYDLSFSTNEDRIEYDFNIVNDGDFDAYISSLIVSTPKCTSNTGNEEIANQVCSNIKFSLNYQDGKKVLVNDELLKHDFKKVTLIIEYEGSTLPNEKVDIENMYIAMTYSQKD